MKAAKKIAFNCEDCQSKESYVDDQGNVCCSYCGTLFQQFFAESFDLEDGMAAVMNRGASRSKSKSRKKAKVALSVRALEADILEFLSLYQYCLLILLRYTMRAAGCNCSCCISDTFTKPATSSTYRRPRARFCMCDSSPTTTATTNTIASTSSQKQKGGSVNKFKCHPVPLSKSLLLGFIYLTFRLQRSWVIPSDIVRWCESGLIPYSTLYEVLPDSCKVDIIKENLPFFISPVTGAVFIAPGRILCLSESIASSLDIPMPPLNAPLVARLIIEQLGLPIEVWTYYQSLSQLMLPASDGRAIDGAEAFGQHYIENIMAVIIIACKCCKDWTRWALVKRLSSGSSSGEEEMLEFAMPMNIAETSLMPRYQLPQLLQRIRSIVPTPLWKGPTLINGAIREVWDRYRIQQDPQRVVNTSISSKSRLHWDHLTLYDSSLQQRNVVMHHTALNYDHLTPIERKVVNGLDGMTRPKIKFGFKISTLKDYCSYITYVQKNKSVVPGIHHMQYLLLLERLARHLRCAPSLLHPLVDKMDENIFMSDANLTTLEGDRISHEKSSKSSAPIISRTMLLKSSHYRASDRVQKQYYCYKAYCDERFPIIRRYGNNRKKLSRKVLKHLMLIPKKSTAVDDEFLDYVSNFDNHIEPEYVPEEERIRRATKKKVPKVVTTEKEVEQSDTEIEIDKVMNGTDSDSYRENDDQRTYHVKSEYGFSDGDRGGDGDRDSDYQNDDHRSDSGKEGPYSDNLVLHPASMHLNSSDPLDGYLSSSHHMVQPSQPQSNLIDSSSKLELAESPATKECANIQVTRCGDIVSVLLHPCEGEEDKIAAAVARQAKMFSQALTSSEMQGPSDRNTNVLSAEVDSVDLDRALSTVKVLLPSNFSDEYNYLPDLEMTLPRSAFGFSS
eukprot:gene33633-43469_t